MNNQQSAVLIYNYIALYEDEKKDKSKWEEKGFILSENREKYIWDEDIDSAMILEKQIEIFEDFSTLKNKQIESVDDCIGSYGMGGLGYFGIQYKDNNEYKWIVIDCQQMNFFMNRRPFTTRTRQEADENTPWYRGYTYHPEKSRRKFFQLLKSMTITHVTYENNTLYISLKDEFENNHKIYTSDKSVREIYSIPDKSKIIESKVI
ncbi:MULTISPECIES: hypothetical protein [Terrisporobacter]|uniref:Uncharacterized protein n=1 Tax=Terrisporobacter othiniensis TaxID=1577792 RepID=A0A0B3W097_9FIRM|nr:MULTISPECIES: hypothetical protein [Terrisporobacter]KHS58559.1 hypothetical protein QX51_02040 [Terrisporobacter othiniensis]MCC3669321.1 hypothetical protein [Terrisporobacter mayombei]MDU6983651.1 hypothetical protein [Terrisporobacter othiniensis]